MENSKNKEETKMSEVLNVEEIFGSKVFTLGKMRERLPKSVYKEVKKIIDHGGELSLATADVVAKAMKDWAIENGATHYTHWFQPLTGITAEKHDAFVTHPDEYGKMIMEFSGKELIKGEPDASSFPSGGLRATFEARGYTAWDITSPAFLKEDATGVILCIPTAFCSYKGEALDKKTPLLRSMEAVSTQALRIVRLFGNTEATKVVASVGPEQEYFLVDRDKYLKREDLIFAGRTLFGAPAPKGQELEDVVKQLVETGDATHSIQGGKLLTGVSTLPDLDKDATDRNRTSPFAFTGNKFEFRMVGSADSIASPNTTLNAIVAEAFCEAADILEKADDFDIAVHDLIKKYLTEHQRIIFNGNGYSEEWVEEAARRGLPNIKSMVEASETLTTEKSIKLFEKFGIFTKAELESREEVLYETYSKTINIEALTMVDMAKKQYIPAVMGYTRTLADTVLAVKSAGADATVQTTVLKSISEKLAEAQAAETALEDKLAEAAGIEDPKKLAFFYKDVVHTAMDDLRTPVDELEMMVDKKVWPVPAYGDLIFEV